MIVQDGWILFEEQYHLWNMACLLEVGFGRIGRPWRPAALWFGVSKVEAKTRGSVSERRAHEFNSNAKGRAHAYIMLFAVASARMLISATFPFLSAARVKGQFYSEGY